MQNKTGRIKSRHGGGKEGEVNKENEKTFAGWQLAHLKKPKASKEDG